METKFATAPSRDGPFVFFGSSHAVLKIAATPPARSGDGAPGRLRSEGTKLLQGRDVIDQVGVMPPVAALSINRLCLDGSDEFPVRLEFYLPLQVYGESRLVDYLCPSPTITAKYQLFRLPSWNRDP